MRIPIDPPVEYGPLLRIERERLVELLASLRATEWHLPTRCPGWSVLDIAVHLVGNDLGWIAWHRDGHRGTAAPEGLDGDGFVAWLDELQTGWVDAARRLSPAVTLELLAWSGGRLDTAIAGQDPAAATASVSWASDRPVPVWLDQARELSERWIHRQQILEAVERPDDLRADLAAPVLDGLRWAYPHRLGAVPRPPGSAIAIDVVGGDDASRRWRLVSDGHGWEDTDADGPDGADVVASMRVSAAQAWRLLTNNHRGPVDGPIDVAGDPELVDALVSTRAIIGVAQPPCSAADLAR